MKKILISLIQFNSKSNKLSENLNKAVGYIEKAFEKGSKCVLLHEMWAAGYQKEVQPQSIEFTNYALDVIGKLAKNYGGVIIAGTLLEKNNGNQLPYNTSYIIGPDGKILSKYRKIHLFPLMDEDKKYNSGNELSVFDLFGLKAGIIICYDIRFPEEIRALQEKNINILFIPAMWPYERKDQWVSLLKARAIENQFYIAAANATGEDNNIKFAGCSAIVDPEGKIQDSIEDKEGIISCSIDITKVESTRNSMPVMKSKRKDLYKKWIE